MTKDPICGMTVDEATALRAERDGATFFFCSEHRRQKFLSTPATAKHEEKPQGKEADLGSHLDIQQLTGCGGLGRVGGMSRPLRIERAGGWYHLTGRGNERRAIFRDHRDRQPFCELLAS